MNISQNLSQARANKNISVYELSKLSGVTQVHIHQIEKGITKNPGVVTLKKLSNVLSIKLDDLLKDDILTEGSVS